MQNIYTFNKLSTQTNCIHLVTQKDLSQNYGFSLALHTGEAQKDIIQNRNILNEHFPHKHFIVANQTHSDNIVVITKPKNSWLTKRENHAIEDCDALITNQKDIILTIMTADCVPVLLFDTKQHVVAIVHAGWKGTQQEIALKTVEKMKEAFDSNPKDIIAGVAPAIGKCCYEVTWNVSQHFKRINNAYEDKGERQMLDLPYINKEQLLHAGLKKENIEMSNICTACEVENYFSYRKEQGCTGRFMSIIGLT